MTDSEIIDALGGTSKVAELFDIKPPSVTSWRESGIPKARRQTLALMYPDLVPREWHPAMNVSAEIATAA